MTDEGDPDDQPPDIGAAAVDDAFRLLASDDRRAVLYFLRRRGDGTLDELADVVAGRRAADEGAFVPPGRRDRLRIALDHTELPLLEDRGAVDYDRETGRVALAELPAGVETLLDLSIGAGSDPRSVDSFAPDEERSRSG